MIAEDYTFHEFTAFSIFLYFYMAFADEVLDETEAEMIRKKIKVKMGAEAPHDDIYTQVEKIYKEIPSDLLDKVIKLNFEKYKEQSQKFKYTLFTDLYDIMIADGVVHHKENENLDKLKKIVNTYL